ncbi:MAG TPA: acyl-CoA dehydrogenase family protein [Acidimicrobiales bacterium]|jgi:alkylation response protein AidB-like acyl-CoA dehydrogenase|nr:acyl-CoA dehydrogenase family protein [Acidimicrobiales bacterium]
MQFSLDDDQLAMRDAARAVCDDHLDLANVAQREGRPAGSAAWNALAHLGVFELLAEGSSVGIVEAAVVFEELGAHLATGPVLWSTLAGSLPGGAAGSAPVAGIVADDQVAPGQPIVVEHLAEADSVLILRADAVERCAADDLASAPSDAPLDPLTPCSVLDAMPVGERVGDAAAAHALRRSGRVLNAAMLVGGAQGALTVARDYALEREQFGVPIGSFQAIKHLLADMYVRVELARAAAYAAAALVAGRGADDPDRATSAAKLLAGEAAIANARTAVQVLGGMGFTWDMLPHYFLKRAWTLEHAFGTSSSHAESLGTALGAEVLAS